MSCLHDKCRQNCRTTSSIFSILFSCFPATVKAQLYEKSMKKCDALKNLVTDAHFVKYNICLNVVLLMREESYHPLCKSSKRRNLTSQVQQQNYGFLVLIKIWHSQQQCFANGTIGQAPVTYCLIISAALSQCLVSRGRKNTSSKYFRKVNTDIVLEKRRFQQLQEFLVLIISHLTMGEP